MSAAGCRSRCRRRRPPRSCARALRTPATTLFSVRARGRLRRPGTRRKVKLEPFLIFNQQFLTLIRAGLPILGSLEMLGKIQKNAQFAGTVGRRVHAGEDRRVAFGGLRGAERIPGDVHHHAAGRRALGQSAGGAGALCQLPARLADLSQEADGLADLSRRAADAGLRADDFHVHGGDSAVCGALRPDGIEAAGDDHGAAGFRQMDAAQHRVAGAGRRSRLPWRLTGSRSRSGAATWWMDSGSACRCSAKSGSSTRWRCSARTLSTLLTGGLPLVPSLETAARSISSRRVSKAVTSSITTVREGKSLADSLTKTGVFPIWPRR